MELFSVSQATQMGLLSLGALFRTARTDPAGLNDIPQAAETLQALHSFVMVQGDHYVPVAQQLRDTDLAVASAGVNELRHALLGEATQLRENLVVILQPEDCLTNEVVLNRSISHRLEQDEASIGRLFLSAQLAASDGVHVVAVGDLMANLDELHALRILRGLIFHYQLEGEVENEDLLLKWFALVVEQAEGRESAALTQAVQDLVSVYRWQGKYEQASFLEMGMSDFDPTQWLEQAQSTITLLQEQVTDLLGRYERNEVKIERFLKEVFLLHGQVYLLWDQIKTHPRLRVLLKDTEEGPTAIEHFPIIENRERTAKNRLIEKEKTQFREDMSESPEDTPMRRFYDRFQDVKALCDRVSEAAQEIQNELIRLSLGSDNTAGLIDDLQRQTTEFVQGVENFEELGTGDLSRLAEQANELRTRLDALAIYVRPTGFWEKLTNLVSPKSTIAFRLKELKARFIPSYRIIINRWTETKPESTQDAFSGISPEKREALNSKLREVDQAERDYPDKAAAWAYARGTFLQTFKQYSEALAAYQRAMDLKAWHLEPIQCARSDILVRMVKVHSEIGNKEKALRLAEKAARQYPQNLETRLALAQTQRLMGQLPVAAQTYSQMIRMAGNTSEGVSARFKRAQIYLELGFAEKAEDDFRQLIELRPEAPEFYISLARVLERQDPLPLDEIMSVYATALDNAADICLRDESGTRDFGDMVLNESAENAPNIVGEVIDNYREYREILQVNERYDLLEQMIHSMLRIYKIWELDEMISYLLDWLGDILVKREQFPEAVEAFERALALDPDSVQKNFHHALALLYSGQVDRSHEEFERLSSKLGPDDFMRDRVNASLRAFESAREKGVSVLEVLNQDPNPADPVAKEDLKEDLRVATVVSIKKHHFVDASRYLERVFDLGDADIVEEIFKETWELWEKLESESLSTQFTAERFQQFVSIFTRRAPNNLDYQVLLAEIAEKAGNKKEARQLYKQAFRQRPDSEYLKEKLRALC